MDSERPLNSPTSIKALPWIWVTFGLIGCLWLTHRLAQRFDTLESVDAFVLQAQTLSASAEHSDWASLARETGRLERLALLEPVWLDRNQLRQVEALSGSAHVVSASVLASLMEQGLARHGEILRGLKRELLVSVLMVAVWGLIGVGIIRARGRSKLLRALHPYHRALAMTYEQTVALEAKLTSGVESAPRGRVLVVDHEASMAASLREALEQEQEVVVETSPRRALERLSAERFDAIFCDVAMTEVSGIEFFQRAVEAKPSTASRFVFVTAGAFSEPLQTFLRSMPHPQLKIPFDTDRARRIARAVVSQGDDALSDLQLWPQL